MNIADINDIQAESGVISTLLYHPEFILHSNFLKPSHFFDRKNGCIYWAIQELYKSGADKIDSFNLSSVINSDNAVKKKMQEFNIQSLDELINLAENVARTTVGEYLIVAKQVTTLAFKRTLYTTLQKYSTYCFDDKYSLGELNTIVYDGITKLSEEFVLSDKIELFGNKIEDIFADIQSRQIGDKMYGIPSKFKDINHYCPYEKQELIVLVAQKKTGKSVFMMNECVHKLKNGIPTVYMDTEMSDRNFTERLLAHLSGVPVYKIKQGSYSPTEEQLIKESVAFIKKAPLVHIYDPSWSNDKIYTTCKILQYKMGLQFVIFDYLKSAEEDSSSQYNDLGNKTNFLKNNIAGGLNLAVLAGAQLNRRNEIADSYKIEQYLSSEIILQPKTSDEVQIDGKDCGDYKAIVRLNRNGNQMSEGEYIDLVFNRNTVTMEQAAKQHEVTKLPI